MLKKKLMVSYEDSESLKIKAKYALDHQLGGIMIWKLNHDDEGFTLLKSIHSINP